jgi:hypothetical protein
MCAYWRLLDDAMHMFAEVDAGEESLEGGGREEGGVAWQGAGCQQFSQSLVRQQRWHSRCPRPLGQDPRRRTHH